MAYLKDSPSGFLYPAVDILAGLDGDSTKLEQHAYAGEHEFQLDVRNVIASAHDQHFGYVADIIDSFLYFRELPLSSVSADGFALPEIYLGNDTLLLQSPDDADTVSPVATIDGEAAERWLNAYATLNGNAQDPDANYNHIFGASGMFKRSQTYQGNHTDISFRNGTTRRIQHYATTLSNFSSVSDGASFFQKFCTEEGKEKSPEAEPATPSMTTQATLFPFRPAQTQTAVSVPPGSQSPIVIADDYSIADYFPEET